MVRSPTVNTYSLVTTSADTPAIPFGDSAGGIIQLPAGSSITSLTFYASSTESGTYAQLYDSSNNAVSRTVAAERAYALPDECFAARWLKIVVNVNGTATLTFKS
jgi:hypothetical protein